MTFIDFLLEDGFCVCVCKVIFFMKVSESQWQVVLAKRCQLFYHSHALRNLRVGTVEGTFGNPERRGLVAMVTKDVVKVVVAMVGRWSYLMDNGWYEW